LNDINEFTEEDVRQFVSNFLMNSGIDVSELKYEEKTITVEIFHDSELKIEKKNRKNPYGKIDILVNKEDKPFIVLEIKKPSVSDNEFQRGKLQVLSYARLLLAPLAIITNIRKIELLDPFTPNGEQIKNIDESQYYKTGFNLNINDELKSIALQHFITYNKENLRIFYNAQREHRMSSLIAKMSNNEKKYIEEIYVPHKNLEEKFIEFLESNTKVFLIDGESGTGKTNAICYIAQKFGNKYPSLFYSASLIRKPIKEEIAQDFNYHFSRQQNFESILKRLDKILREQNTSLLIFIDAVDEYQIDKNYIEIKEFYDEITPFERIKLCINIKTINIHRFLCINDIPTIANSYDGYTCGLTDSENFDIMFQKYEKFFQTVGTISEEVKKFCALPFFMRMVFETYSGKKIPEKIIPQHLIEKYLEKKLRKIPFDYHYTIYVILQNLANFLYDKNVLSIPLTDLYKNINNIQEPLNFLIQHYLLVMTDNKDITFYYDRIRDYYVIFHTKKWNKINIDEFKDDLDNVVINIIGQSALTWYIEIAPDEQKKIMNEFITIRALKFIKDINIFIDKYFKQIKKVFLSSFTNIKDTTFFGDFEKIGILLLKNRRGRNIGYVYRGIKQYENFIITEIWQDKNDALRKYCTIHGGNEFESSDIEKWAKSSCIQELKNIFRDRLLIEGPFTLIVRLVYLIHRSRNELGYKNIENNDINNWFCKEVFPIDIDKFKKYNIQKLILYSKWDRKLVNSYPNFSSSNNGIISTTTTLPFDHEEKVRQFVNKEIKEDFILNNREIKEELYHEQSNLIYLINNFQQYSTIIEEPKILFSFETAKNIISGKEAVNDNNSTELSLYLKEFFSTYINELRIMGEKNFSHFNNIIESYKINLLIAINININSDGYVNSLTCAIVKNPYTNKDEYEIRLFPDHIIDEENFFINSRYGRIKIDKSALLFEALSISQIKVVSIPEWCYNKLEEDVMNFFNKG
jgi:hypothetical protein